MSGRVKWLITLVAAMASSGCGDKSAEATKYQVMVRALDEDGEALSNLTILASGVPVGRTGPEGTLLLSMPGREGSQVLFEPRCPAGAHGLGDPPSLRLRTLGGGPPPEVEVVCGRDKRVAALVVSARGFGGLPVLVHDREVARTDATGTAHVLLEGSPATPMRVVLDTRSLPRVVPQSPHQDFQIGKRDDIVVFSPELTEIKEPPKKRRVKKAKPKAVIRPERLR